jgi:long-chain acyl-CoA synthetase
MDTGIERGDRVAIMARNDIEYLEISLAIAGCGGNPVPVNTRWRAPEVAHVLTDSAVRLVIAHTEFVPTVEAARDQAGADLLLLEVAMPPELLDEAGLDRELGRPTGRHPMLAPCSVLSSAAPMVVQESPASRAWASRGLRALNGENPETASTAG